MQYEVIIKRKVLKGLPKFPVWVQKNLVLLIQDLESKGPKQPTWKNYSKLSKYEYHCHLGISWVACWRYQKPKIIEVYYAGSREKAPY